MKRILLFMKTRFSKPRNQPSDVERDFAIHHNAHFCIYSHYCPLLSMRMQSRLIKRFCQQILTNKSLRTCMATYFSMALEIWLELIIVDMEKKKKRILFCLKECRSYFEKFTSHGTGGRR